jgi:hypothetical protein
MGRLTASGTVTLDGTPLETGTVVFAGDNGGSAGVGVLGDGGKFTLAEAGNSDGIQPGTYKVAINAWIVEPGSVNDDGEIVDEGQSLIPQKYNNPKTSGLSATVSAESTDFTFALVSE